MIVSKTPKFIFTCQDCRKCCSREKIQIYYSDLQRWVADGGTITRVWNNMEVQVKENRIELNFKKKEDGTCMNLNNDTNECEIDYSKPISCSAYPLGYDGNAYFLQRGAKQACEGLGKGEMTPESLKEMRLRARKDFECRMRTNTTLPYLQMLIVQMMQRQTEEMMKQMSDEDRKKLEELMKKQDSNSGN